jgi:hypothetical protein
MPGMVWCLGMYASASTWLFNSVSQVVQAIAPREPVVSGFVLGLNDLGFARDPAKLAIVKSHETDGPAGDELGRRAGAIFVSIRDPRDAVASLVTYQGATFDKALDLAVASARLCGRFARDPRALLLHYETGFTDDPRTLATIAARLGRTLVPADQARIFTQTRRDAVERYIAGIAKMPTTLWSRQTGDYLDPATHWHRHHAARTGEIGRWQRVLDPAQAAAVEERLADWFADFGYAVSSGGG